MKRWLADTLFKRLFLLMWCALVVSHFAAFSVVHLVQHGGGRFLDRVPTLPSLPPSGGRGEGPPRDAPPPAFSPRGDGPPWRSFGPPPRDAGPADFFDPDPEPHDGGGPPGLAGHLLALDYAIRLFVIGFAAWLGARWLSQPMRKLVQASQSRSPGGRERPLHRPRGVAAAQKTRRVAQRRATRHHHPRRGLSVRS